MAQASRSPRVRAPKAAVETPKAPTPSPQNTAPNAAPIKLSGMNRVMSILPRVVASAAEQAHGALLVLAERAKEYAKNVNEARQAQAESLVAMLQDGVAACLKARKAGAKTVKNADIDRILIEAGVREPRLGKDDNGLLIIGSKSGASRYIALATMENEDLWTEKNADALRFIKANGLQFEANGPTFKTPYDAIIAGVPMTSVHDVWVRTIKDLNNQVAPVVQATKLQRLNKQALNMTPEERAALVASLTASLTATPKAPVQG